jgi:hypothetical protein
MKRIVLLTGIVVCLIGIVAAQNDELPSCTATTVSENIDTLNKYTAILVDPDLTLAELSSAQSDY